MVAAAKKNPAQINEALRRIADGRYGSCEKCQGAIPRERLEILPHARSCLPCQQKHSS